MIMRRLGSIRFGKKRGFTLIELAIVLAVTSLLTAGLWRMMSAGNTQLRDQAAADQHRDLINAIRSYLASPDGQTQLQAASPFDIDLDNANVQPFLPGGVDAGTTNPYGQKYEVRVAKSPAAEGTPTSYSFMIKTTGGEAIPDTSGGRISSTIGNDGGFVYAADVCGAGNACGSFGTWFADPTGADYQFPGKAAGEIASRTFVGLSSSLNVPWLARLPMSGNPFGGTDIDEFNTIQTNISLGDKTLFGTGDDLPVVYGGALSNIRTVELGRTAGAALEDAPLTVNGNCNKANIADMTCNYAAQFNGAVSVTNLLMANMLYANQFIYDSSDRRLKKDIKEFPNILASFKEMNGYSYVMKDGEKRKYGVMAQEVEKFYPDIIQETSEGYKTVDYMGLIGPLVGAVHKLTEENEAMKADIQRLTRKIEELKK